MSNIAEWRKAIAAAVIGVPAWGVVAQVDGIDPVEWWGLAGVLATAAVVWLVPNESPTVSATDRLRELGLYDDEPTTDAGAVAWGTVALVIIAIVVLLWAFGEVPR